MVEDTWWEAGARDERMLSSRMKGEM